MAKLVQTEPITPFLHRVRALYQERGVSTILVAGSCGDFFDVADIWGQDNFLNLSKSSYEHPTASFANFTILLLFALAL